MNKLIDIIKKNKNDIIKPVAVLLAICIVIPLALSLTNKLTAERIAVLEENNSQKTMESLIKADSFEKASFSEGEFEYFVALKKGETLGYIFKTSEKGYGGEVSVMTAVNPNGTVKAVALLDLSDETPGLGQNAGKESFYSQYSGKKAGISLLKNGADPDNNEVDAVTGATITSTAVNKAVNKALQNFEKLNTEINEGVEGENREEE